MATDSAGLPQRNLLGFFAHPGTLEDYLQLTEDTIAGDKRRNVLYHNLHSLYSYFTSASLREHYQGNTVLVDGMPLIWLMRLCRIQVTRDHRLTYVDFITPLMQLARDRGWQVFHLGQQADIQARALDILRERCPGLQISGHDGYFDQSAGSAESQAVIDRINASGARILLIGFGAPRQEAWLHAHREQIDVPIVFTCGACMEYVAGAVRTPPRWMGKLGLEWSFRLLENPRRFAFRYLVEPVLLGAILLRNGMSAVISGKRARQT